MFKRALMISGLALLSGCAFVLDSQQQEITLTTLGAENAVCHVLANDIRYDVNPPITFTITKSDKDMIVDCLAPGNRRKKIVVEVGLEESTWANAANAGAGLPWDYASRAMFDYPDHIEVDFSNIPIQPQALPAHNNPDIKQPEEYDLEEFSTELPRLNADKYAPPPEPLKRRFEEMEVISVPLDGDEYPAGQAPVPGVGDKGSLTSVIEDLRNKPVDPAGTAASESSSEEAIVPNPQPAPAYGPPAYHQPTPLYPGE